MNNFAIFFFLSFCVNKFCVLVVLCSLFLWFKAEEIRDHEKFNLDLDLDKVMWGTVQQNYFVVATFDQALFLSNFAYLIFYSYILKLLAPSKFIIYNILNINFFSFLGVCVQLGLIRIPEDI